VRHRRGLGSSRSLPGPGNLRAGSGWRLLVITALSLGGCSGVPEAGEKDPAIEQQYRQTQQEKEALRARQQDMNLILLRLDEALAEYVVARAQAENERAERRAEALKSYLDTMSRRHKGELLAMLDPSEPARRHAIAAAALGFADDDALVAPLLNLLTDREAYVRTNACLGLGQLARPVTPLDTLMEICRNPGEPIATRRAAAWALLRVQIAGGPAAAFRAFWPEILVGDPVTMDASLAVHALRGLGMLRDPSVLEPVARYFSHPQPLVRQAALVAAGRSRNRGAAPLLLASLSDTEPNLNVRLTARKALKALTGDRIDHEYDVAAWRREFDLEKTP
jgi:hypothetical protein